MNKWILGCALVCLGLVSCIETETETTIKSDGSGTYVTVLDMSQALQMMAAMKAEGDEEEFNMDSTIYYRDAAAADTKLSAREKELLSPMKIHLKANSEANEMRFTITVPFKKAEDLGEITSLVNNLNLDKYIDGALGDMSLNDGEGKDEDDTMNKMMPNIFVTNFKKGNLQFSVSADKLKEFKTNFEKDSEEDQDINKQMMDFITFSHVIIIPADAKSVKGKSIKQGSSRREWKQEGSMGDIFKDPSQYEYTITY